MAIIINTVDTNYFTLNGTRYAKIYIPLKGIVSTEVGIYNSFDTRQQTVNSTPFSEYTVDGFTFLSADLLMEALLPVVYKYASVGGGGIGTIDWGTIGGLLSAQTDLSTVLSNKSDVGHSHSFASLTGKPTTLAGFGITNAYTIPEVDSLLSGKADNGAYLLANGTTPLTGNWDVGAFNITAQSLTTKSLLFDTTYIATGLEPQGSVYWNPTDNTLDLVTNGATLQIGQELYIRARNTTGGVLLNGSVVYITGRTGIFPNIALAKGDSATTGNVIGVLTEELANNGFGMVTTTGYVRGIKTNYTGTGIWGTTWAEGDNLYLSKTTAGTLTNVEPAAPHHSDRVGSVGHAAQGTILVLNNPHTTLESLSDVNGTPLTVTGQIPVWDNTNKYFDFTDNINNYLPLTGGTLTGTLTVPQINLIGANPARIYGTATGATNVGYMSIYENNGTTRQGYFGFPSTGSSNMYMSSDVAGTQLLLEQAGGVDGLKYYDGVGTGTVWHSRNDGAGSLLDADTLDGKHGIQYCESGDGITGGFNDIPDVSKLSSINANLDTPHGNAWYTYYQSRHRGGQTDGTAWASQIAIGMTAYQDRMSFRTESSGVWSSWTDAITNSATNQTKVGALSANWLQTNNSGATASLLAFNMERSWAFEQGGTGAGTYLVLRDLSGAKSFAIQSIARENKFIFNPDANLFSVTSDNGDSIVRIEADTSNTDENNSPRLEFKQDGGATTLEIGLVGNTNDQFTSSIGNYSFLHANNGIQIAVASSLKGRWYGGGLEIQTGNDLQMSGTAAITRTAHNGGYLEGSFNNVGANGQKTNPIYVIGSGYVPADSTLSNMYGIGYCQGNATFLTATDLGTTPATGWGMYIAADGEARIFLDATNGRGHFKNNVWAANFILNSDKRYKKSIKYINDKNDVRGLFNWAQYEYKNNSGIRYGLIADDVEKTNPELVGRDSEGMRSLGYMDVFSLDAAHKDKRITELEDTVEELRAKLDLLIKELL